jgi:hypothetical protein
VIICNLYHNFSRGKILIFGISFCSLTLCLELVKEVNSIADLLIKLSEIIQVTLYLINGKIDKHACDLGSSLFSNELFNIFIDELSNDTLVVGILRDNSWKISESLLVVSEYHGVSTGKRSLRATLHSSGYNDLLSCLRNYNGLGSILIVLLRSDLSRVSVVVTIVSTLNSSRSGSSTLLLLLLVVSIIVVVLTSVAIKVIIERHAAIELSLKK